MRAAFSRAALAIVLATAVALGGCTSSKEGDMDLRERAEAQAVVVRGHVDDLVQRLDGTGVSVAGDDIIDCDPQDPAAGLLHNYTVRFTVEPGAAELLQGDVADALQADGWTVRRDAPNAERGVISVRFLQDGMSMGAKISETGNATAGGSSGCVT